MVVVVVGSLLERIYHLYNIVTTMYYGVVYANVENTFDFYCHSFYGVIVLICYTLIPYKFLNFIMSEGKMELHGYGLTCVYGVFM